MSSCSKDETLSVDDKSVELPSNYQGIMKFESKTHISEFFNHLDALSYSEEQKMYNSLGINPLSYHLESLEKEKEFSDYNEETTLVINDPYLSSVLNSDYEVIVGDDIIKYIGHNLYTTGDISEIDKFIEMRSTNGIIRENLTIMDDANSTMVVPPPTIPNFPCTFVVDIVREGNFVYVKIIGIDPNGNELEFCAGDYSINWGDGVVSTHNNESTNWWFNHNYDESYNSDATYDIEITFTPFICGNCNNNSSVASQTITLPGVPCTTGRKRSRDIGEFFFDNQDRKAKLQVGYRNYDNLISDAYLWGQIKTYRYNNFWGWFELDAPDGDLEIRIHGNYIQGAYDGQDENPESEGVDDDAWFKFKYDASLNGDYSLKDSDPAYVDFWIFHSSDNTADVEELNVKIFLP